MAELLGAVKSQLKWDEVDHDNWVFKLFSRVSFALCLTGSLLCAGTQYFGTPITCNYKGEDSLGPLLHQYCWIHGSYFISSDYQDHFGCITDQSTLNKDSDTSYYQWVIFMLLFNAALFLLPHKLWKIMESGILHQFGKEAKTMLIQADEAKFDATVKQYVRYFLVLKHRNTAYFYKFVFCEFLNIMVLAFNFAITNKFLDHKFSTYGLDVLQYYNLPEKTRLEAINPMCNAFPTKTSCDVKNVGPTSQGQTINAICILSQNIVNEKVFLALWFWYALMFTVSVIYGLLRLATLTVPSLRASILFSKVGGTSHRMHPVIHRVLKDCQLGDWFLLSQLGKNTNPYFFKEFLLALLDETKGKNREQMKEDDANLVNLEEFKIPLHNSNHA